MGLERFMKRLDVPPFVVDGFERGSITGPIPAGQIQRAGAALLVCKDLPEQKDGKVQSFDPRVAPVGVRANRRHLCARSSLAVSVHSSR